MVCVRKAVIHKYEYDLCVVSIEFDHGGGSVENSLLPEFDSLFASYPENGGSVPYFTRSFVAGSGP